MCSLSRKVLQIWQVSFKFWNSVNIWLSFLSIQLLTLFLFFFLKKCMAIYYQKEVVTSGLKECVEWGEIVLEFVLKCWLNLIFVGNSYGQEQPLKSTMPIAVKEQAQIKPWYTCISWFMAQKTKQTMQNRTLKIRRSIPKCSFNFTRCTQFKVYPCSLSLWRPRCTYYECSKSVSERQ